MLFSRGYGAGGGRCVGEGTMASIYIIICTRNTKFLTFSFGYLTLPSLFGSLLVTTPTPSFYTPSALHPTPLYIGNTPRQGYLNILFAYPIFPSSFLHPAHFSFFRFQPLDFYTPTALHCVDRYQLPAKLHICPL